jgi:hypothetical protein
MNRKCQKCQVWHFRRKCAKQGNWEYFLLFRLLGFHMILEHDSISTGNLSSEICTATFPENISEGTILYSSVRISFGLLTL